MDFGRDDYNKIHKTSMGGNEPGFLLRGKDKIAIQAVRHYALLLAEAGAHPTIIASTLKQANKMEEWQCVRGGPKLPDLPD